MVSSSHPAPTLRSCFTWGKRLYRAKTPARRAASRTSLSFSQVFPGMVGALRREASSGIFPTLIRVGSSVPKESTSRSIGAPGSPSPSMGTRRTGLRNRRPTSTLPGMISPCSAFAGATSTRNTSATQGWDRNAAANREARSASMSCRTKLSLPK